MSETRTVILLRHGRSTANTAGILAGHTEGVHLDEWGTNQAEKVATRLVDLKVSKIVSSPLERCLETLAPLARLTGLEIEIDADLAEVDYGTWTGRPLKDLASEDLWKVVQQHASAAVFPGGEGLAQVSARAVAAVRRQLKNSPDPGPLVICSHGDVIKAIVADALGLHLDAFQRIHVAPASLSVVTYTATRPIVERVNDSGDLTALLPATADSKTSSDGVPSTDGVVGGGSR
ncbi:MSMEG_4193 family putative phosphomutase [Nakamurella antarctica]|uniref:MSMEG_4193 family putative phosphomutase n=1 Tax=Nakamurella antarctica TaxID=1902245 RepID=A0A3G8ZU13_9ACTN|nr:MSMEG_4193 family putative phosphomutase [Nakamurella antarctica]AZI57964.1 MSMEG_4193 family putative phosphomutase [Nakamurella antarctica]